MKTILIKKKIPAVILSTYVLLLTASTQADIYKWTDTKGVTHYSSQKPIQQEIKTEDIEDKIRSSAGKPHTSSQKVAQKPSINTNQNNTNGTQEKLAGPSQKLVSYCKSQRKNLALLKKNYRNIWKDKDGKTTRLNQKQRQEKVNLIQESITTECAGV